jgi:hypothetical protein
MAGRYYSVQFTDPSKNTNFAYVGKRTTGMKAGDYLRIRAAGNVTHFFTEQFSGHFRPHPRQRRQ